MPTPLGGSRTEFSVTRRMRSQRRGRTRSRPGRFPVGWNIRALGPGTAANGARGLEARRDAGIGRQLTGGQCVVVGPRERPLDWNGRAGYFPYLRWTDRPVQQYAWVVKQLRQGLLRGSGGQSVGCDPRGSRLLSEHSCGQLLNTRRTERQFGRFCACLSGWHRLDREPRCSGLSSAASCVFHSSDRWSAWGKIDIAARRSCRPPVGRG